MIRTLIAVLLLDTCLVPPPVPAPPAVAQPNPNILVILLDDAGIISTPYISQLAAMGANFSEHDAKPLCTATRAALLTGRSNLRRAGKTDGAIVIGQDRGLVASEHTFAEYLRAAGYDTGIFGKWHLDGTPSRPERRPLAHGFRRASYSPFGLGQNTYEWWEQDAKVETVQSTSKAAFAAWRASSTPRTVAAAVEYIQTAAIPYLAYVPTLAIHTPSACASLDQTIGETQAQCSERELDDAVGQIVSAALARDANTYVLVLSDNGRIGTTPGLRGKKGEWYEGGIRATAILYGPGIHPSTIDVPIIVEDWFPTLLELAGVPLPAVPLDGVSLVGMLTGGPRPASYLLGDGGYYREDCLKRHYQNSTTYDLCADPGETTPVVAPADFVARAKARKADTK